MREACVRLFSLLHRANFVSVSPHPGRFLHYFWLSLSLSGSLRACFFYIRSVDEERNLSFPFFFLFGLSLRSFVRSKRCAGEYTHSSRVSIFACIHCMLAVGRALGPTRPRKIKQLYILASSARAQRVAPRRKCVGLPRRAWSKKICTRRSP